MDIGEILGKVGFDWQVALANLVNFLIIVIILKLFVFKPIQNVIKKRTEVIDGGLKNAEEAKDNLDKAKEERETIVNQAKKEAESIILDARAEGNLSKDRIEELARLKELDILKNAEVRAGEIHDKALQDVRDEAADLVVDTVQSVLEKELTAHDKDNYAKSALDKIKK